MARQTTTGGSSTSAALSPIVGARGDDFARFELHAARGLADVHDAALGFDVVAGVDRREEFDAVVGGEEPLVAVHSNEQLGRDVAEEREHARAVDEVAAVVRVVRAHAHAQELRLSLRQLP